MRAAFAAPEGAIGFQPTAGQTYSSSGGAVTQRRLSTGLYEVTFAQLAATGPVGQEGIQITQRTTFGTYCGIVNWRYAGPANSDLVVRVLCQHEDGSGPEDHDSRILVLQLERRISTGQSLRLGRARNAAVARCAR